MDERMLVTGGLGFMGSAFVRRMAILGVDVVNADLGTYAADEQRIELPDGSAVRTERVDVASEAFASLVARVRPTVMVHFAAETHVTRSERDAERFLRSNVQGTRVLLTAAEET